VIKHVWNTCITFTWITVPTENVATIKNSAHVTEGVSRTRNALINGDTRSYDWDSGYTCHQLGSGAICIQLSQPYILSTMRLLLWDCDDRSYSFYIEVSTDSLKWTQVVDKRHHACKSWQTVAFEPLPVTFIRIVGTNNTANEVFHCVHFESPADLSVTSLMTSVAASVAPPSSPRLPQRGPAFPVAAEARGRSLSPSSSSTSSRNDSQHSTASLNPRLNYHGPPLAPAPMQGLQPQAHYMPAGQQGMMMMMGAGPQPSPPQGLAEPLQPMGHYAGHLMQDVPEADRMEADRIDS